MLIPNPLPRQPVVIRSSSHNPSSSTVYVPVVHPLLAISILFRCASPVVNWISSKHHLSYWFSCRFSVFAVLAVVFSWDMQREEVILIHSASINWINCLFLMTQSNVVKKPLSAASVFSWPLSYLIYMGTWEGKLSKGKAIPSLLEYLYNSIWKRNITH